MTVTSSNLNLFSYFFTSEKYIVIPTKLIWYYPSHLKYVAALPREVKNSAAKLMVITCQIPPDFHNSFTSRKGNKFAF